MALGREHLRGLPADAVDRTGDKDTRHKQDPTARPGQRRWVRGADAVRVRVAPTLTGMSIYRAGMPTASPARRLENGHASTAARPTRAERLPRMLPSRPGWSYRVDHRPGYFLPHLGLLLFPVCFGLGAAGSQGGDRVVLFVIAAVATAPMGLVLWVTVRSFTDKL